MVSGNSVKNIRGMSKTNIMSPPPPPHDPIGLLLHHLIIDIKEHIGCIIIIYYSVANITQIKALRGNVK